MPLYEYQCNHCEMMFEVRASFQEKEQGINPVCPTCQSAETSQLLAAGLFVRKASGNNPNIVSNCGPMSGPGCCG